MLPTVHTWPFDEWPDVPPNGFEMEFRLTYDGKLPAASQNDTRAREKHEIRRTLSKQLAELWATHPRLKRAVQTGVSSRVAMGDLLKMTRQRLQPFDRCGRRFMPLIDNSIGIGCSLDILFLRRDQPGGVIRSGGDIDNRLKVLFDALKMPSHPSEVFGDPKDEDDPFHCLLEDDRLITEVRVTTDRLLLPRRDDEHVNDVRLIIHVKTIVIDSSDLGAVSF
jgi:hypothetical protein